MNEVRHVLTALRSPAKSSTLNNGVAGVATTTWYDVPAPIIVHCREFHEEAERGSETKEPREKSSSSERDDDENTGASSRFGREAGSCPGRDRNERREERNSMGKDTATQIASIGRFSSSDGDALYQNNVEAALNSLSKVCTGQVQSARFEVGADAGNRNDRRHSSTVELSATTTVKTDADGIPTISFSFLRTDERRFGDDSAEEIVVLEVDTSDQLDSSCASQLYDLPKSSVPGSSRVSLERADDGKTNVVASPRADCQDVYDVPRSTGLETTAPSSSGSREEDCPRRIDLVKRETASAIVSPNRRSRSDQTKRSTRSLKSGRRSYGASDSDGYDAGIASMSGSYSDPECPNEETATVSGDSGRSKRLKLQKHRLGRAWGRMRSWLREERTKIGEVVNRHARLQAVGALSPEVVPPLPPAPPPREITSGDIKEIADESAGFVSVG